MASLCQSQQRCVKASILSSWSLAEAQDQLCSLGVHSSESLEQERARTLACPAELTLTEEEWRRKESVLGGQEPSRSPVLGDVGSWDVFDKVGFIYFYLFEVSSCDITKAIWKKESREHSCIMPMSVNIFLDVLDNLSQLY